MRNLSKIALSILSTLVVSSVFAQCPAGGPCPYQQGGYDSGYYGGGYGGSGYSGNYSYSSPNYDSSPGYGYSSGSRQRTARGHFRNVPPQSYGSDFDGQMQGGYYQPDSMGSPSYQGGMGMQGGYYQQDQMYSNQPGSMSGSMYGQPSSRDMYSQPGSRDMYSQPGSSGAGYSTQGTAQPGSSTSSTGAANPSTGTQQR